MARVPKRTMVSQPQMELTRDKGRKDFDAFGDLITHIYAGLRTYGGILGFLE